MLCDGFMIVGPVRIRRGNCSNVDKLPDWLTFFFLSAFESLDEEDESSVLDEEEFDERLLLPSSLGCVMVLW